MLTKNDLIKMNILAKNENDGEKRIFLPKKK